jgi:hypothetical protein
MTGSDLLGGLLRGIVRNRAIETETTIKHKNSPDNGKQIKKMEENQ